MINSLAIAIMARFAPFIAFSLLYFNLIKGSLVIKTQLLSTKHALTRLLPHWVIRDVVPLVTQPIIDYLKKRN